MKSSFSDKCNNFENITLVENNRIISDDKELASTFNNYFSNVIDNLNLKVPENLLIFSSDKEDPISNIIIKYQNHPSILAIKEKLVVSKFSFKKVSIEEISKQIQKLDNTKATQKKKIFQQK